MLPNPMIFIGFGAMDVTKPYEFKGFGVMAVTKPYEFIGFGAMSGWRDRQGIQKAASTSSPDLLWC